MRKPLALLVPMSLLVLLGAVLAAPDPAPSIRALAPPPQAMNLAAGVAEPGPEPSSAPTTAPDAENGAERPTATESATPEPPSVNPVLALQIRLNGLGYRLALDGIYGPLTRAADLASQGIAPTPVLANVGQQWPTSLEQCGGDLPPCYVKNRESHGDYSARNPSSGACGAWQFIPGTWAGFEGYASACDAPPAVQDEKARQLWNGGRGCGHWSAC